MAANSLPKSERIRSERRIGTLFSEGRRGGAGPVKYCWMVGPAISDATSATAAEHDADCCINSDTDCGPAVSVMFSAPKKVFKRAWKRNLVKRRLKESYRQRKAILSEAMAAAGRHIDIAFIYSPTDAGRIGKVDGTPHAVSAGAAKQGANPKQSVISKRGTNSKRGANSKNTTYEVPDFKTLDNAVATILEQILARS